MHSWSTTSEDTTTNVIKLQSKCKPGVLPSNTDWRLPLHLPTHWISSWLRPLLADSKESWPWLCEVSHWELPWRSSYFDQSNCRPRRNLCRLLHGLITLIKISQARWNLVSWMILAALSRKPIRGKFDWYSSNLHINNCAIICALYSVLYWNLFYNDHPCPWMCKLFL